MAKTPPAKNRDIILPPSGLFYEVLNVIIAVRIIIFHIKKFTLRKKGNSYCI